MSRTLQTCLIYLAVTAGSYFVFASVAELLTILKGLR